MPVLSQIGDAIGPGPGAWVYTSGLVIGLTRIARLSDIFGRGWFSISGVLLGVIGSITVATANKILDLIGDQTIVGISAASGYS